MLGLIIIAVLAALAFPVIAIVALATALSLRSDFARLELRIRALEEHRRPGAEALPAHARAAAQPAAPPASAAELPAGPPAAPTTTEAATPPPLPPPTVS